MWWLTLAMYIPASRLLIAICVFVILKALWRLGMNGALESAISLSLSNLKADTRVVALLPILFICATASIWVFSVTIFPVFVPRYFFPNMLIHAAWITLLFYLFFKSMDVSRHHLFKAAAAAVLAIIVSGKTMGTSFGRERIPCFDPTTGRFMEDEAALKRDNVIVHSSHLWLSRQDQNRNTYFAGAAFGDGPKLWSYDHGFMKRFKAWASASTILNDDSLPNVSEFYILEDKFYLGDGQLPIFGMSQLKRAVEVRQVSDSFQCRLWHVKLN